MANEWTISLADESRTKQEIRTTLEWLSEWSCFSYMRRIARTQFRFARIDYEDIAQSAVVSLLTSTLSEQHFTEKQFKRVAAFVIRTRGIDLLRSRIRERTEPDVELQNVVDPSARQSATQLDPVEIEELLDLLEQKCPKEFSLISKVLADPNGARGYAAANSLSYAAARQQLSRSAARVRQAARAMLGDP